MPTAKKSSKYLLQPKKVYAIIILDTTTDVVRQTKEGDVMGISSDIIRGYNDLILLYLLLDGPSYAYEVSKQIKTLTEDKYIIKQTTLYSAFTRLEKNGFVISFDQYADNGKRRTYYRITDQGRRYYYDKVNEWELIKDIVEHFIREY